MILLTLLTMINNNTISNMNDITISASPWKSSLSKQNNKT